MTAALGRCLTVTSLMGSLLKDTTDSLSLQIKGDGPAGTILCVSDYKGNVRGYAQDASVELPPNSVGKLDVGGAVGGGSLCIIRDFGTGEPYVGISPLVSGEIAEDISQYYVTSEQTPTVCALGIRANTDNSCKAAGGFLLQLLPGADETLIPTIEANITAIGSVSKRIEVGHTPADIVGMVFEGIEFDFFDEIDIAYVCTCERDRYKRALIGMSEADIAEITADGTPIETQCRFCQKTYTFTPEEILTAREEAKK